MTRPRGRRTDELLDRLDAYLTDRELSAVWFGSSVEFARLTGGDNTVDRAGEPGVAAVGYDGTGLTVVTNNIEADRLAAEELPAEAAVETVQWHDADLAEAVAQFSPRPAAADFPVPGFESVDPVELRYPLTQQERARYADLGGTTARALEAVCRDLSRTTTEREAAAAIRRRLTERGVDTPVVLVGGERRAQAYRHFTPTDEEIGAYALLSVTARREGLHASCTRTVAFDPPPWLRERHTAAARVEVSALSATRHVGAAGGTAGDVFDRIRTAYAELGFEGEWRHHHQGGATGYAGREWIATPGLEASVELPMAFAWNPSVTGAKSEDTVYVTDAGFDVLTATGSWPTREIDAVDGSLTLERPTVLAR